MDGTQSRGFPSFSIGKKRSRDDDNNNNNGDGVSKRGRHDAGASALAGCMKWSARVWRAIRAFAHPTTAAVLPMTCRRVATLLPARPDPEGDAVACIYCVPWPTSKLKARNAWLLGMARATRGRILLIANASAATTSRGFYHDEVPDAGSDLLASLVADPRASCRRGSSVDEQQRAKYGKAQKKVIIFNALLVEQLVATAYSEAWFPVEQIDRLVAGRTWTTLGGGGGGDPLLVHMASIGAAFIMLRQAGFTAATINTYRGANLETWRSCARILKERDDHMPITRCHVESAFLTRRQVDVIARLHFEPHAVFPDANLSDAAVAQYACERYAGDITDVYRDCPATLGVRYLTERGLHPFIILERDEEDEDSDGDDDDSDEKEPGDDNDEEEEEEEEEEEGDSYPATVLDAFGVSPARIDAALAHSKELDKVARRSIKRVVQQYIAAEDADTLMTIFFAALEHNQPWMTSNTYSELGTSRRCQFTPQMYGHHRGVAQRPYVLSPSEHATLCAIVEQRPTPVTHAARCKPFLENCIVPMIGVLDSASGNAAMSRKARRRYARVAKLIAVTPRELLDEDSVVWQKIFERRDDAFAYILMEMTTRKMLSVAEAHADGYLVHVLTKAPSPLVGFLCRDVRFPIAWLALLHEGATRLNVDAAIVEGIQDAIDGRTTPVGTEEGEEEEEEDDDDEDT